MFAAATPAKPGSNSILEIMRKKGIDLDTYLYIEADPVDEVAAQMQALSLADNKQEEGKTEVKMASPEQVSEVLRNIVQLILNAEKAGTDTREESDKAIALIKKLPKLGIPIDTQITYPENGYYDQTILFIASQTATVGIMQAILAAGANPNLFTKNTLFANWRPIHYAACYSVRAVKMLINSRANPNARVYDTDERGNIYNGFTPLFIAWSHCDPPEKYLIIRALLFAGADLKRLVRGETALRASSRYHDKELVKIIIGFLLYRKLLNKRSRKEAALGILNEINKLLPELNQLVIGYTSWDFSSTPAPIV